MAVMHVMFALSGPFIHGLTALSREKNYKCTQANKESGSPSALCTASYEVKGGKKHPLLNRFILQCSVFIMRRSN